MFIPGGQVVGVAINVAGAYYSIYESKNGPITVGDIGNSLHDLFDSKDYKAINRDGKYHVTDPLILDLNNNGIQALATNGFAGALFDHDNDGIRTAAGWVNAEDGLLVRDVNGNGIIDNGSELFGDNTTLADGSKAAHGFVALAQLDSNSDGKVDALDSAFNELKVWIDANSDGISQASELRTLMDLDIQSLDVAYKDVNQNLGNGNAIRQLGSYTKTDGSTAQMGDAWFAADKLYSRFTDKIDMTAEQSQAANLSGIGRLRDLNQAAAISGDLANVLKAYSQAQTKQEQLALLDSLVHEWAETDSEWGKKAITFDTTFTKTSNEGIALTPSQAKKLQENALIYLSDEAQAAIDAARDRIAVLDAFTGQDSSKLYYMSEEDALNIIKITNQTYDNLATNIYQSLLLQTRLQPYMNEIAFKIEDNQFVLDFAGVQAAFNQVYENNPEKALVDLAELLAYGKLNTWYQGRQLLAHYVETARTVGTLDNVLDVLGKETVALLSKTSGNKEDNILQFTGLNGRKVSLYGGEGNDILIGGSDNDYLDGGVGSDTYVFGQNFGKDTISNYDVSANRNDTIHFTDGIRAEHLNLTRTGDSLFIKQIDTDNRIEVQNFFHDEANSRYIINQITFDDGSVLNLEQIKTMVQQSTDGVDNLYAYDKGNELSAGLGNDYLYGAKGNDVLNGDAGDDIIYGRAGQDILSGGEGKDNLNGEQGDDTLNGGAGNDYLYGGEGNDILIGGSDNDYLDGGVGSDTYVFGQNFGKDTISNYDVSANRNDTIHFTDGIRAEHLNLTRTGDSLFIKQIDTDNRIEVQNFFHDEANSRYIINQITFDDGSVLNLEQIKTMVQQSTDGVDNLYAYDKGNELSAGLGNDYLYGAKGNDVLNGDAGDDIIYGRAGQDILSGGEGKDNLNGEQGDDTLNGGAGNDYLYGGEGNDILIGGSDNDYLDGGVGSDTYVFGQNFGKDTISNYDVSANRNDTIHFTDGIRAEHLNLTRTGDSLFIKQIDTDNRIEVQNFFHDEANSRYIINQITFDDGSVLNLEQIKTMVQQSTDGVDNLYAYDKGNELSAGLGNDYLYGAKGNDVLNGDAGDDIIYGRAGQDILSGGEGKDNLNGEQGDDTLNGGAGNDYLYGGEGNDILIGGSDNDYLDGGVGSDTYVFGQNFGKDTISNYDVSANRNDTIHFTDGIRAEHLNLTRTGDSLFIKQIDTDNRIEVQNFFHDEANSRYIINQITFDDGSVLNLEQIKTMVQQSTDGVDNLYAYDKGNELSAGLGNDYLYGAKGNDVLNGDAGDDIIYGRAGQDILSGGEGKDNLNGEQGDDTLNGGAGNDYLYGGEGNDILIGGSDNDYLDGGVGSDTYVFGQNFGKDTISNYDVSANRNDTIHFTDGIRAEHLNLTRTGDSLFIKQIDTDNRIEVQNFFHDEANSRYIINQITFDDGSVLNLEQIKTMVQQSTDGVDNLYAYDKGNELSAGLGNDYLYGAKGNDVLNGDAGDDIIYGRAGQDILSGGEGKDNLNGEQGDDTLNGGAGNDYLYGGEGNDILIGGSDNDYLDGGVGSDTYVFGQNFGKDTISNYDVSANRNDTIHFTDGIRAEHLNLTRTGDSLFIKQIDTDNRIEVQNFFHDEANSRYIINQITFDDGSVLNLEQIKTMVQQSTDGVDNLYAYDKGNELSAGLGNDYLYGAKGNDVLNGDAGDDIIYGRAGQDILSGGEGKDNLNGEQGDDTLNGGAGNDYLYGGEGNDILIGGSDNDYLDGGVGSDTYVFNKKHGSDTIYNYDNNQNVIDTVVLADVSLNEANFSRQGSDLIINGYAQNDAIRIQSFFSGDAYKVEQFVFADQTLNNADFAAVLKNSGSMVQAMAAFGASESTTVTDWNSDTLKNIPTMLAVAA
ncbi:calcium-binding protein [Neisseriaceae bacterium B1]